MNALNSPLIPDNERAYLMYLKYIMEFKIAHLESIVETVVQNNSGGNSTIPNNNGGNANNPYNLPNDAQNQAQNGASSKPTKTFCGDEFCYWRTKLIR